MIGMIVRCAVSIAVLVTIAPSVATSAQDWPPYTQGNDAFRASMKGAEDAFRDARPAPASSTLFPYATRSRVKNAFRNSWDLTLLDESVRLYDQAITAITPFQPADLRACDACEGKARALAQLGMATRDPQKLAQAVALAWEALRLRLKVQGDTHYDVGVSYQILAEVQYAEASIGAMPQPPDQAIENFQRALRVLEAVPRLDQPGSGAALYSMASTITDDIGRSHLYRRALDSLKGQLVTRPRAPAVLLVFIDVADAYFDLAKEDFDLAKDESKLAEDAFDSAVSAPNSWEQDRHLRIWDFHMSKKEKLDPTWREAFDLISDALFDVAEATKSIPNSRVGNWDGLLYEAARGVAQKRDDATGLYKAGRVIQGLGSRLRQENTKDNASLSEAVQRLDQAFNLYSQSLFKAVQAVQAVTPLPPLPGASARPPLPLSGRFVVPEVPSGSPASDISRAERAMSEVLDDFLKLADHWDSRSLYVDPDDKRDMYSVAEAMVQTAPAAVSFLFQVQITRHQANRLRLLRDRLAAETKYQTALNSLQSPPGGRKNAKEVLELKRDVLKEYVAFLQEYSKFYPENTLKSEKDSLDALEGFLKQLPR